MAAKEAAGNLMINNMLRPSIFILLLTIISCSSETEISDTKNTTNRQEIKELTVDFNVDSAYYFISKQVEFGPRVISSSAWQECALWLEKKLKSYAD